MLGTSVTLADLNNSKSLTKGTGNSSILSSKITASALNNGSLAKGSAIFAKGNLTINAPAATLTNNGSIISSRGDVNINVGRLNNITNSIAKATIKTINIDSTGTYSGSSSIATGNVNITANVGDVLNLGGNIKAINGLNLTANTGSIINSSIIRTNDQNLLNLNNSLVGSGNTSLGFTPYQLTAGKEARSSGNISSTLMQTASLSGGSISINAGNDFTNLAAEITTTKSITNQDQINNATAARELDGTTVIPTATTTTGNTTITAGDDVNISTLQLHNRTESSWGSKKKGGSRIIDTTTNIGSNINSEGTINLTTTGLGADSEASATATMTSSNINITGSNLTTTGSGSNINIASRNEVNITSAINTYHKEEYSHKKGSNVKKTSTSIKDTATNIQSNIISANDISITSGDDANIIASNLSGEGSGNTVVGVYLDHDPTSLTYNTEVFNPDAKVNIFNGKDTSYSYANSTKTKTGIAGGTFSAGVLMVAMAVTAAATGGVALVLAAPAMVNGAGVMAAGVKSDKQSTTKGTYQETVVKSNINFNNNLTISSAYDLTVKASNLTTVEGDIALTSGGNINILSDTENKSSYQSGHTDGLYGSNKQQSAENNSSNNVSSIITAGSDTASMNGNLELTSTKNTTLQAAILDANKDITLTTGENLNILTAINTASTSYTNNDETTFNFTNGASGNFNTEVINTEITSNRNSITINTAGQNFVQYRGEDKKEGATEFEGKLAYLNNLDPTKTIYNPVDEVVQSWDQTTRGLTEVGQGVVAVAAAAVAIGTGGIGSGISGAMVTAVATTTATTATISATNASMNADGNLAGSLDDVGKTALKDTTSKEAIKNYAIAAAVAGASAWAVQASGGSTSLEKGGDAVYKPSEKLISQYPERFKNYNGVIDPAANNIGIANTVDDISLVGQPVDYSKMNSLQKVVNEGGFISNNANKVRGMNPMSTIHDPWGQNIIVKQFPVLQITIVPAIAIQYCATFPAACGVVVGNSMNNDFGTKK